MNIAIREDNYLEAVKYSFQSVSYFSENGNFDLTVAAYLKLFNAFSKKEGLIELIEENIHKWLNQIQAPGDKAFFSIQKGIYTIG